MTLAYTFWHQPRAGVPAAGYAAGMAEFHRRLAAVPFPGFVGSWTLAVPDLPWLPGGGYEDWYLIEDHAALGRLDRHAVDAHRSAAHDAMAGAVGSGAGGLQALLAGDRSAREGWCGWFTKAAGVGYPALRAEIQAGVDDGSVAVAWQRQLVLGPAPEFRVLAPGPVELRGAVLERSIPAIGAGIGPTDGSAIGPPTGPSIGPIGSVTGRG